MLEFSLHNLNKYLENQRKQGTISKNSSETKHKTIATVTISFEQLSLLYCDNDSARYIAANPMFHKRTKYIEINCHIGREN